MNPDTNPLFDPKQYNLPVHKDKVVQPLPKTGEQSSKKLDPAVELVRQKIRYLYKDEPDVKEEVKEAFKAGSHRSKHQQFMYELTNSGRSLAEIQTAWHNYYLDLPDNQKHEVWQEFYTNHSGGAHYIKEQKPETKESTHKTAGSTHQKTPQTTQNIRDVRSVADIKDQLIKRVAGRRKPQKKEHLKSLFFGLGLGSIVLMIMLFGFFNERFIAPFITPSKVVSSTPIIIDPRNTPVSAEPKIIIPKINVEAPVIYNEPSIDEKAIQRALEEGVLHYATSPDPGELGNGAIFGHSSGNIFNEGKYKYAFILLKSLTNGDVFYLQKDSKRYIYKVVEKKIVKPTEVSVLNSIPNRPATFTLITCDPPGTSVNRLVVIGEQISPNPSTNIASKVNQDAANKPAILPSNSKSLWNQLYSWLSR